MPKLSDLEINFIRLIARSPDRGDGWRTVSPMLWRMVDSFNRTRPELIEFEGDFASGGKVRLSERGNIVQEYM